MAFFDRNKYTPARIADLVVSDQLGFDRRAVVG
jgi:hypothetical protein